MSETKPPPASVPGGPLYQVVASGESVVMVNTQTGQTWAMTSDGTRAVWHPVRFEGGAPRAPRAPGAKAGD